MHTLSVSITISCTMYVQTTGMPERGNPPPSSEIFIVISYHCNSICDANNTRMNPLYLFSMCNDQLDRWVFIFVIWAKSLDHGTQRVLEQLKHHMVQMRWHIHEFNVTGAKHLYLWGSKESVMVLTNKPGIGNSILSNVLNVCPGTYNTYIISHKWATIQGWMLAYQHSDTNSGHVETIQKLLDVSIDHACLSMLLVLHNTLCHSRHYWVVSAFDILDGFHEWVRVREYRRCALDVFKVVVVSMSYGWIVFSGWFWLWNSEVGCALR